MSIYVRTKWHYILEDGDIHIFRSETPKSYYIIFQTYDGNHNNLPRDVVEHTGLLLRKDEFENRYSDWLDGRGLIPGFKTVFLVHHPPSQWLLAALSPGIIATDACS
jgi:hypothetical protein